MSIEVNPDLDLDRLAPAALSKQLLRLEKQSKTLATVAASTGNSESIKDTLCSLRASGISPLLLVRKGFAKWPTEEILAFFGFLRDWDQLLLRNLTELAGDRIPAPFQATLAQEAKTELKWFQEWQTAVADPRIHRYPGLPWRSFLRKVNAENFAFAQDLLRDDATLESLDVRIRGFLVGKKKTICVFPKNWGKR
jgi:hypothetical protein